MKKRIIYFITKSGWGGAAKYVTDLAQSLAPENFEIFIAAGGRGPLKTRTEELGLRYLEIPRFERRITFIGDLLSFFEVLALLWEIEPDTIHVNSSKAGGVCGLAGFVYKIFGNRLLMIFTAHGWAFHESRSKWQLFLIRFGSKISCLFYDKIVCITTFDYNSALRWKIAPQRKLVLVHNGINPNLIFFSRAEARKKIDIPSDTTAVVNLAEWTRNKGIDVLLRAAAPILKSNQSITLVLIGSGENPDKKEVEKQIEVLNIKRYIKLIDFLPEAARYLKAFDIFIFPSRKEGLPYALLEASLAELPIIATAVGGNFDIIETDKTGVLIPPENPEILQKTLDKFLKNLGTVKKLGKNARKKVESEFTLQKMRKETYKLYGTNFPRSPEVSPK